MDFSYILPNKLKCLSTHSKADHSMGFQQNKSKFFFVWLITDFYNGFLCIPVFSLSLLCRWGWLMYWYSRVLVWIRMNVWSMLCSSTTVLNLTMPKSYTHTVSKLNRSIHLRGSMCSEIPLPLPSLQTLQTLPHWKVIHSWLCLNVEKEWPAHLIANTSSCTSAVNEEWRWLRLCKVLTVKMCHILCSVTTCL